MITSNDLYKQVKPDIESLATPLFDFSEFCLRKRGNFLPHGAILTQEGKVELVGTAPDLTKDYTNSTQVLPILHQDLRKLAIEKPITAIGVAENVTVKLDSQSSTKAIKVLVEHQCGLSIALYLPFTKRFLRGYEFGEMFIVPAKSEVKIWQGDSV